MKKLFIATAIAAFAISTVPTFVAQANAAPAKNPLCALARQEKNPVAWNEFYGCLGARPKVQHVAARSHRGAPQSDFCKLARQEKNPMSWNEFYGCWHH